MHSSNMKPDMVVSVIVTGMAIFRISVTAAWRGYLLLFQEGEGGFWVCEEFGLLTKVNTKLGGVKHWVRDVKLLQDMLGRGKIPAGHLDRLSEVREE